MRGFYCKEHLGYEMSGDGEFVALYVPKKQIATPYLLAKN